MNLGQLPPLDGSLISCLNYHSMHIAKWSRTAEIKLPNFIEAIVKQIELLWHLPSYLQDRLK